MQYDTSYKPLKFKNPKMDFTNLSFKQLLNPEIKEISCFLKVFGFEIYGSFTNCFIKVVKNTEKTELKSNEIKSGISTLFYKQLLIYAGHFDGTISIWSLESNSLIKTILPVKSHINYVDGHLFNSCIIKIFVNENYIVSVDNYSNVFSWTLVILILLKGCFFKM